MWVIHDVFVRLIVALVDPRKVSRCCIEGDPTPVMFVAIGTCSII